MSGHQTYEYRMTSRARWYLNVGAGRHLAVGGFTLFFPGMFSNPSWIPIINYAPLWVWALGFIVAGAVCIAAALLRSANLARIGLILSASITLACGVGIGLGIAMAWVHGQQVTPIIVFLLLSLAFKDYVVCTQPMASPFESLMKTSLPVHADGASPIYETR